MDKPRYNKTRNSEARNATRYADHKWLPANNPHGVTQEGHLNNQFYAAAVHKSNAAPAQPLEQPI
eukprot:2740028-Lingulodinium_polyedra.AAC.1